MREGVPGGAGQGGGANHGVMSPSLTSGFSGSGDCKSTETCSLLSVASYSSATPAEKVPPPPVTRHVVSCEVSGIHSSTNLSSASFSGVSASLPK